MKDKHSSSQDESEKTSPLKIKEVLYISSVFILIGALLAYETFFAKV